MESQLDVNDVRFRRIVVLAFALLLFVAVTIIAPSAVRAEPDVERVQLSREVAVDTFGAKGARGKGSIDAYTQVTDGTGAAYVPVFKDERERESIEKLASSSSVAKTSPENDLVTVTLSRYDRAVVDSALAEMEEVAKQLDGMTTIRYDPLADAIEVATTEENFPSFAIAGRDVEVTLVEADVKLNVRNEGYNSPHYGAMAAWGKVNNNIDRNEWAYCSMGIPAKNANGTPGIFGAAHCWQIGYNVYSSKRLGQSLHAGYISHSYGWPTIDAAFMSGGQYGPYVLTGLGRGTVKPVVGEYYPSKGERLCFNGATTGQNCSNHVQQYDITACYGAIAGWCSKVDVMGGGTMSQPGDSGAPVYANFGSTVKVNGIIFGTSASAGGGTNTTLVTSFHHIKHTYNATLWTA